jgi:hypothetical protein
MSTPIQSPDRQEHASAAPLRSYLFLLAPRTRRHGDTPVIHYVLEESPDRAIEVCDQAYPDHRIVTVRDVTDQATAA